MQVIFICLFFTIVFSQNWNWVRIDPVTAENGNRLSILQNAYSQIIPFNWFYSQEEIDASQSPDDIYWLRTFASGPHVEIGSMQVIPNYYSPVNGGVDRSPLYTVVDVLSADISTVFNYSLVGHTLTQVIDRRQPKFKTVGFNFGGLQQDQQTNPSMHYFQVGTQLSFDRKPFPGYGRAFHSAVFDPDWETSGRVGAVYIFGGMSEIVSGTPVYVNDFFRFDLPFLEDGLQVYDNLTITDMTQGGSIPPARAGHSGVLYNGEMIIFGGYDGTNTLNSVFAFDLETGIWTGRSGAPFNRAFHSTHLVNDRMYIFGGSADTSIHNDLHYYDISNDLWVEVPNAVSINPRIGHSGFTKGNSLLIQGGTDNTNVFGDWWFLEVDGPECLSYCSTVEECVSDQLECDSYALCEDSESFRCDNGQCYDDWAECNIETCAEETCWNGLCASSQDLCAPFPSCPYGVARCDDGTCSIDCENDEVECSDSTTLCADGTCREVCMPYMGCLPNKNNTLCHAGHCSDSFDSCQSDAPEDCGSQNACWDDACRNVCDDVLFRTSTVNQEFVISVDSLSDNTNSAYDIYPEGLPSIDPTSDTSQGLGILLVTNNSPQNKTFTGRITPVSWDVVSNVGPMPYWNSTFDKSFFVSTVTMLEMDDVDLSLGEIAIRLLLKLQPKRNEDVAYCFAHAVEWYWHEFDAVEWGPNANLDYFVEFRKYYDPEANSTDTDAIRDIQTPEKRWKCASTEGYPYTITSSLFYTDFAGNYLDEFSPVAVILNPSQPTEEIYDISLVSYLIAIVVGAIFLTLTIVTLVQTFCGEDSDCCMQYQ